METITGYLLEKKKITYHSIEIEVIKVVDYVVALMYKNRSNKWIHSIISGEYVGEVVYDDEDYEIYEGLYISQVEPIEDVISKNDDVINMAQIRKDKLSYCSRFYRVMTNFEKEHQFCSVEDKDLIDFLEKNWNLDEEIEYNPSYDHGTKTKEPLT